MAFDCSLECVCRTDGGDGMCRSRAGGFCGTEDLLRDAVFIHWPRPRSATPLAGHHRNTSSTGAGVSFHCCWSQIIILFCIKYMFTFFQSMCDLSGKPITTPNKLQYSLVFMGGVWGKALQHCPPPTNFLSTNKKLPPNMLSTPD